MKSKFLWLTTITVLALMFTSCKKENIDELTNSGNPDTEQVTCDLSLSLEETNPGELSAIADGGTAPYSYEWSTDETESTITVSASGSYTVTCTDSEGCFVFESIDVVIDSTDCAGFGVELREIAPGVLMVEGYGGTPPYVYQWSTGETTDTIGVNDSGVYTVIGVDANGCSYTTSIEVTVGGIDCSNFGVELGEIAPGVLMAAAYGGTPPYVYEWSNGATTDTIAVNDSGVYTVTGIDANGCTFTTSIEITIGSTDCSNFGAEYEEIAPGILSVEAYGGTPPYAHEWSTGETTDTIAVTTSGIYTVTSFDSNGCTYTGSIEVTLGSTDCSGFGVELGEVSPGVLMADAFGGTPPYAYEWSTGETTNSITVNTAGTYTVTSVDANGCLATQDIIVN